jgi:hypothetical protein
MKKGIYQPPNIVLGFKLIEFHRFWWICVLQGFIRKRRQDIKDVGVKNIFHNGISWEGSRIHKKTTHRRGPLGSHPGWPTLPQDSRHKWVPPISLLCKSVLYRLRVYIFAVDQGRFDLRALVHPTGLYKLAPTPGFKAFKSFDQVIRARNPSFLRAPPYSRA